MELLENFVEKMSIGAFERDLRNEGEVCILVINKIIIEQMIFTKQEKNLAKEIKLHLNL